MTMRYNDLYTPGIDYYRFLQIKLLELSQMGDQLPGCALCIITEYALRIISEKSREPRKETWETPELISRVSRDWPVTTKFVDLPDRKYLVIRKTFQEIHYLQSVCGNPNDTTYQQPVIYLRRLSCSNGKTNG